MQEEVEEEHVHRGEHAHQAALHDEEQHEVELEALGLRLDGVEPGSEANEAGEDEELRELRLGPDGDDPQRRLRPQQTRDEDQTPTTTRNRKYCVRPSSR